MQTGLFGKLPAHGDFIARGLSVRLRKALDRWVTANIGQRELPDDGLRARLMLAGEPVLAVILQSHDRSGRVFPIIAGTKYSDQNQIVVDQWCNEAAAILDIAIQQGHDASAAAQQLPPAPGLEPALDMPFEAIWQKGQEPQPILDALAQLSSD